MSDDTQVKQEAGDWPTVKALTREWLTTNGIALTGVNGEVSRSTVNRFKLALQRTIVDLLATVRREEREAAFKEAIEIAKRHWVLVPAESENRPLDVSKCRSQSSPRLSLRGWVHFTRS